MVVAIYDADPRVRDSKALNAAVASAASAAATAAAAATTTAATATSETENGLRAVVLDGNLGEETAKTAAELARAANAVCVLEPVSEPKAGSAAAAALLLSGEVDVATPNRGEVRAMATALRAAGWDGIVEEGGETGNDDVDPELRAVCTTVLSAMASRGPAAGAGKGKHLLVTEGARGVILASLEHGDDDEDEANKTLTFERFRAPPVTEVVSATGAGDTFLAGTVCGLIATTASLTLRESLRRAIPFGLAAARETLGSTDAVAATLSWDELAREADALGQQQRM